MVYRRNYRKSYRPRRYRPRRYRKTPDNAWKLAYSSYKLGKRLARLVNVEKKVHEVTVSSFYVSNSGTRYSMFGSEGTTMTGVSSATGYIAQGDASGQRDGDSIKPLSIRLKGEFYINVSATNTTVRMIVFQKPQTNASAPNPTDYLQAADPLSLKNWYERFRFKTLSDKTYHLTASTERARATFDITHKLYGHVTYTHGSTTCETGGLYVLFISDESTNQPACTINSRIIFVDN